MGTPNAFPLRSQSVISTAARAKGSPLAPPSHLAHEGLDAGGVAAHQPGRDVAPDDSSPQVGPSRHAASPQPTSPSPVSTRTKTKFTCSSVLKDILCR